MKLFSKHNKFDDMSDKDIVEYIKQTGDDNAVVHLLYHRFANDIKSWVWRFFKSYEDYDDLVSCLFIQLKGKKNYWQSFRNFRWECPLRNWLRRIAFNLFDEKRKELIYLGRINKSNNVVSVDDDGKIEIGNPVDIKNNELLVITMEAISRLGNEDYRFIFIKELQGYSHRDIAAMFIEKDRLSNKVRKYNGKVTLPDEHYINMLKGRAKKEIKILIEQIKKEWYEC